MIPRQLPQYGTEKERWKRSVIKKEREGEREKGRKGGRKELGHRNRMSALFK